MRQMDKLETKDKIVSAESRKPSPSEKAWSPTASYFPNDAIWLDKTNSVSSEALLLLWHATCHDIINSLFCPKFKR